MNSNIPTLDKKKDWISLESFRLFVTSFSHFIDVLLPRPASLTVCISVGGLTNPIVCSFESDLDKRVGEGSERDEKGMALHERVE